MEQIRVCGTWSELAELAIERKIKLSKLNLEISKTSSPISTNIIHVILCLPRKDIIYLPPKRCPAPVWRDLALHPDNTPMNIATKPNESFPRPIFLNHSNKYHKLPTHNKPLSRKQMSATRQVATKSFQLPGRTRCCSNVAPLLDHPIDQAYCVSQYSRASPGCGKVDWKLHLPHIQGSVL